MSFASMKMRTLSGASREDLHKVTDDMTFLSSSFKCLSVASGSATSQQGRGVKRRKIEKFRPSDADAVNKAPLQDEPFESMSSLVREPPSFRGCALHLLTFSAQSVQRTISGLTSGLSFLSPRPRTRSGLSDSSKDSDLTLPSQPEGGEDEIEICPLHKLMALDCTSAIQAKDLNALCPLSSSPLMGRGPLHLSLCKGAPLAVVQHLLSYDATATRQLDVDGMTPLHLGLKMSKFGASGEDTILAVLEADPSVAAIKDCSGKTPLHWALSSGASSTIVNALLEANPDATTTRDMQDRIPLHFIDKDTPLNLIDDMYALRPTTATMRDCEQKTPLHKLAGLFHKKGDMASNLERALLQKIGVDAPPVLCQQDAHGSSPLGSILDRCYEATKSFCGSVEADMKLLEEWGKRATPLALKYTEKLKDMGVMLRSLNMYFDHLVAVDYDLYRGDSTSCEGISSVATVEMSGGTSSVAAKKRLTDSTCWGDISDTRTTDMTEGSLSTTWTPLQSKDSYLPFRYQPDFWDRTTTRPIPRREVAGSGNGEPLEPNQEGPPWCAGLEDTESVTGTNNSDVLVQENKSKTETRKAATRNCSFHPKCNPLRPRGLSSLGISKKGSDDRTGEEFPLRSRAATISTLLADMQKDAGCGRDALGDIEIVCDNMETPDMSLTKTSVQQQPQDPCSDRTDAEMEMVVDISPAASAESDRAKTIIAYQSSLKQQKTTEDKLRVITDLSSQVPGPPSEAGPRRFFFRVQKIVRCLHTCYEGDVTAFCVASPKLDIARFQCPNGHNHRVSRGTRTKAPELS